MQSGFAARYRVLLLLGAAVACGGQSGNEGEAPAAPCSWGEAVIVGTIEELGGGCVSVRVDRVIAEGEIERAEDGRLISEPQVIEGDVLRGHLDRTYAWRHEFTSGENIVAALGSRGDALSLRLFRFEDDRVLAQYRRQLLPIELDDFIAVDCQSKLEPMLDVGDDVIESNGCSEEESTATSPPEPEPVCQP